jgi:hypothetical protein
MVKSYYAMGAYPTLFAFGATQLERFTATRRRWLRMAFIAFPVAIGCIVLTNCITHIAATATGRSLRKNEYRKNRRIKMGRPERSSFATGFF